MNIDYYVNITVGYKVTSKELKHFLSESTGRVEMQPRWDPKTGKPMAPERVDIPGEDVYRYKGAEYELLEDLVNDICKDVGASYDMSCSNYDDEPEFVIGPMIKRFGEKQETGPLTVGRGFLLSALNGKFLERARSIGAKLRLLDIRVADEPAVIPLVSIT